MGTSSSGTLAECAGGVSGARFGVCGQVTLDVPPVSGTRFGVDGELQMTPPAGQAGNRFGLVGEVVVHGP
jgi:hypothetical protein